MRLSASISGVFRLAVAIDGTKSWNPTPGRVNMKEVKKVGYRTNTWRSIRIDGLKEPRHVRSTTALD